VQDDRVRLRSREQIGVDAEAGVVRVVDGLVDAPAEEPRPGESAS